MIEEHFTTTQAELKGYQIEIAKLSNLMGYFYSQNPEIKFEEIRDALSEGQLASKQWLITELFNAAKKWDFRPMKIAILGGWIGTIPWLLNQRGGDLLVEKIYLIDKDRRCKIFSDHINSDLVQNGKMDYLISDVFHSDVEHVIHSSDIVINTSCEHFLDYSWLNLIKPGSIVIAQSNNYTAPVDHVNTCKSAVEFASALQLSDTLYLGTMKFPNVYDRYMTVGIR